jgi:hypothetical protein
VILSKFWSRYDLQNFRKRIFLGDDQGELSKGTVYTPLQQGEGPGNLTLDIAEGFPPIKALLVEREGRLKKEQGLYLRLYRAAPGGPQLITNWNGYTNSTTAPRTAKSTSRAWGPR